MFYFERYCNIQVFVAAGLFQHLCILHCPGITSILIMLSHGFPSAKQSTLNRAGQQEYQLKGKMDRTILFALADKLGLNLCIKAICAYSSSPWFAEVHHSRPIILNPSKFLEALFLLYWHQFILSDSKLTKVMTSFHSKESGKKDWIYDTCTSTHISICITNTFMKLSMLNQDLLYILVSL